jgi:TonB family protein
MQLRWLALTLLTAAACVAPVPDFDAFPARAGADYAPDRTGEPEIRKAPKFPPEARNRWGWVVVSGLLDRKGWVREPIVLASWPGGVFDEAALRALRGWKYAAPPPGEMLRREVRALIRFEQERSGNPQPGGYSPPPSGGYGY